MEKLGKVETTWNKDYKLANVYWIMATWDDPEEY